MTETPRTEGDPMSETEKCTAAANLKGEHVPCDERAEHTGWPHGNAEHGLIWDGPATSPRMTGHAGFKPGDRVYVVDAGLAKLREIVARAGAKPTPNHHGTVSDEQWDDASSVLVVFDDGGAAPYPVADVRRLADDSVSS